MVKLSHAAWNKLPTIVSLIIFLRHFHGIYAARCHSPVGHAVEGSVKCKRLLLGEELKIPCSGVVHKNGILVNETSNVFVTSVADYGSYRCSNGRDDIVTYLVLPGNCNFCADEFVTVDIKQYNLTHINITCAVHITSMEYCCNLLLINGHPANQGLSKMPLHQMIYQCVCSLKCDGTDLRLQADVESNYTTFDPINISSVTSTPTTTAATTTTTTTASSITKLVVYSSVPSTSISPTCICDQLDIDDQHRGSIIGEIIGSFMAGVVIATIIILLTGAMCMWTTKRSKSKRSRDQTIRIKSGSITSSPGVSIEFGKNNTVVRYHPAPTLADDQLEPNNTTNCSEQTTDVENPYSDSEGPEGTINTVSSNIDISSTADTNDSNSTSIISAGVEHELQQPLQNNSTTTATAQVATPEQCTQVRNQVYRNTQQNQRRRTFSHSSATSLRN